ncbi:MFS transporter [Virgibacillus necropolis]|uniref:MFS transporter n=1 Tax=Virgibacillus necropolis TaxID=163877 RepID=UPI00384F882A
MNKQLIILLVGRIVTNFADSFYMIVTLWYVKSVTDSVFLVGLTSAIAMLPVTIQFLYGPIIDRFSKRKILYVAVIGQGILVSIISILYFSGILFLPILFLLMFLALSLSEATYPTESASIEKLSSRKNLTKVNSIFAFSFQTLDIVSDAISGFLILFVGIGVIYISNGVLLIGTGLMFFFYLKIPKSKKESNPSTKKFFAQYKEDFIQGFRVVRKQKLLLSVMFGVIAMNVMGSMGIAMLPIISSTSVEFGFWLTAMSIGTLIGTVITSRLEEIPLNRVMPIVPMLSGVFWILSFITVDLVFMPFVLFGLSWVGIGIISIYIQTLIQVNLPEDYLGIGFSFISSLLGCLSPLGYFVGGILGEFTSGTLVLLVAGTGYVGFSLYFLFHPKLNKLTNKLSDEIN